jgi:tricarboxylate carrier
MAESPRLANGRIDVDKPRWEQRTFLGRLKHFAWVTDYRSAFISNARLLEAKTLVQQYRTNQEPPGTPEEKVWYAKKLYESAFHPDSGELQNVIGRMSFQVPGGMILTAGMLQFYRTNSAVIFWQWLNQSFNALVNYTNRNAASSVTTKQIAVAYVSATTSALVTALGFKSFMSTRAPPLMHRFVPFLAVAAANLVNIPLSRQAELSDGIVLFNSDNEPVTESRYAAVKGISLVAISRITMAAPGMLTMPFIMEYLEKKPQFMRFVKLHLLFQTFMVGCL